MSGGDWKDMYAAAVEGDLPRVRYHIASGVDPNYQHPEVMCTALVASLIHGHDEIARYLLSSGANPGLRSDMDDLTPLQAARRHGRAQLEEVLVPLAGPEPAKSFWGRWLPS